MESALRNTVIYEISHATFGADSQKRLRQDKTKYPKFTAVH